MSAATQTEYVAPAPVAEYIAPAPADFTTPAPHVHAAPAPMNEYVAFASVIEYVAHAPVTTFLEPHVPVGHSLQVPQLQIFEKSLRFQIFLLLKVHQLPRVWELLPSAK